MPLNSDGTYRSSNHGLTVTARTLIGDDRRAHVCLAGDIDMAAGAALSETLDWLAALAPVSVRFDLADVTFACSMLPNFVVRVRQAVPESAEIILWRARPATGWVLQATQMAAIATLSYEPTEAHAMQ